jgi:hypothetical protein
MRAATAEALAPIASSLPGPAPGEDVPYQPGHTSFLFLVGDFLILILVTFRIHLREFEWFGRDNFKFGAALIADHDIPFFHFVWIEIENALTFRAN